jgi:Phage Terminase
MPAKSKSAEQKAPPTIIQCTESPKIWASWFKDRETWTPWLTYLKSVFALPLDEAELATFQKFTGRSAPLATGYTSATLVCGRRAGKSLIVAMIAAYLAAFRDWTPYLVPGESAHIVVVAQDRRQAQAIFKYIKQFLAVPHLAKLVERETAEILELNNRVVVEVMTANFRSIRGRTVVAALLDELGFWRSEDTANPDSEVVAALKPSMATIPNAIMLKASSPYAKKGVLWTDYQKQFGQNESDLLVWQASTREMNSTVPQSYIDAEIEEDPLGAAAEYGAQFRSDLEAFVSREVVEACTMTDRFEIPPLPGVTYQAWCDPSGGSADSMTLAIASKEGEKTVLHAICEAVPPFAPSSVVEEFCTFLNSYGITFVTGDRYAGMWPRESFSKHGIAYRVADLTASDVYTSFLPMLNSRRVELLDHKKMRNQLIGLERRTSQAGRDAIGHAKGSHDDVINAAAGACVAALRSANAPEFAWCGVPLSGGKAARAEKEAAERLQSQDPHLGLATRFNNVFRPEGYTLRDESNYLPRLREG